MITLDLEKAYDRVNRTAIIGDCENRTELAITKVLRACLQPLRISTKGDVLNTTVIQRLGLTLGAPLSTIIFLMYIEDLGDNGTRAMEKDVK